MENTRKRKIEILNRAFNYGCIDRLKLMDLIFINIVYDKNRRKSISTEGNNITVCNYSFDEIEALRTRLLKKYNVVWLEEKTYTTNGK